MDECVWVKCAYVNLIEVFLLVKMKTEDYIVGQTVFKGVSSKVIKHEKTCCDNQLFSYFLSLTLLVF